MSVTARAWRVHTCTGGRSATTTVSERLCEGHDAVQGLVEDRLAPGNVRARKFARVRGAFHDPALGRDPGSLELLAVGQAFVPQGVQLIHADHVRRQAFQIGGLRYQRPCTRVVEAAQFGIVEPGAHKKRLHVDEVPFALQEGFEGLGTPNLGPGDEWAHRIDAVELAEAPFPLCPDRHGRAQVAAAGVAVQNELRNAQPLPVGVGPREGAHAVGEARWIRVGTELARRIAELHAHHHEASRGQERTVVSVHEVVGRHEGHGSAVRVQEAGRRP
mmetsp:Transcript_79782/g.228998  ORF Transcript_79782/g.228998 Transcript_79782/m.228998 type:complete len:274 (+) Transcript_79782:1-822(+)